MGYPSYDYTLNSYARDVARTMKHPTRTLEEMVPVFALGVSGESISVCRFKEFCSAGRCCHYCFG